MKLFCPHLILVRDQRQIQALFERFNLFREANELGCSDQSSVGSGDVRSENIAFWHPVLVSLACLQLLYNWNTLHHSELFIVSTNQVEVARPNWALIRPSSSADMFSMRSNYMVWKRLQAHFSLDNGLELAWSEVAFVWDGLNRSHFSLDINLVIQ